MAVAGRVQCLILLLAPVILTAGCADQPGPSRAASIPTSLAAPTTIGSGVTATTAGVLRQSSGGAVKTSLSSGDIAEIDTDYQSYLGSFFSECPVAPVTGTLHAAEISATGTLWAFATFAPTQSCRVLLDGKEVDPYSVYPLVDRAGNAGVFEKISGEAWVMNSFESNPFPCPALVGHPPGDGSPFVPLAVLEALNVKYAKSCEHAFTPLEPR